MVSVSRYFLILILAGAALISAAFFRPALPKINEVVSDQQISASSVRSLAPINPSPKADRPELPPTASLAESGPPEINLESAAAVNLATNFYFLEINSDRRWPMASLTKLLTAVVALENFGDRPLTRELLERMIIISDNAAAEQIANLAGDRQWFLEKMRIKAQEIGMAGTSIFDPTGLSFLNQSTVKDLEKLANYIAKNQPLIFQLSRQPAVAVGGKKLNNINRFAGRPRFLGGKTGYTDEASGNLISIFQYRGQPVLIIVLGTAGYEERFNQTELLLKSIPYENKASSK